MPRIPEEPNTTPLHIWNPLTEDFITYWADENNNPKEYVTQSQQISTYPYYLGIKIARKLAQKIVLDKGIETNYEDEFNAKLKELLVEI